nr:MAG TPA: ParA [Caudoviricetes sp.]
MDLDLSKAESGSVDAGVLSNLAYTVREMYDVMLIDCPPAFNAASASALIAADDVVIPVKLDAFALQGMGNLMRQISNMRKLNPKLRVAGVLPTMWYKDKLVEDSEAQLKAAGLRVYPHIRQSKPVDKMTYAQQPLCISSPRSGAGLDYRRFAAAYVEEGKSYGL